MHLSPRDNEPTIDIAHPLLGGGMLHLWLVEGISNDTVEDVLEAGGAARRGGPCSSCYTACKQAVPPQCVSRGARWLRR